MSRRRTFVTFVVILVAASARCASGAVVVYNEAINGDLPATNSPLPVMALDVGTNTVTGKSGDNGAFFDFDSFAFSVPAGAQLVSGNVALTDLPGGNINDLDWVLQAGSANYFGGSFLEFITGASPGTYTFTSPPLGPNVYNVSASSAAYGGAPAFSNYTFTLVVEATRAVPEPGMFLVALVLIGLPATSKKFRTLVAGYKSRRQSY